MWLTEAQAAKTAQVDRRTIRRLIEAGRLRAVDLGDGRRRCYRICPADLDAVTPLETERSVAPLRPGRRRRHPGPSSIAAYLPEA